MIAILWTARNGPNPVPQDARSARCVAAEGAMVTQSRSGAHWSECFQIRCLKSAVRLERRDEEVTGCCSIDTVPTVSAIARGTPRCKLRILGFCGGIRASVSELRSSKSALTLAAAVRTEHRPVRFGRLPSRHRGCAVEGG